MAVDAADTIYLAGLTTGPWRFGSTVITQTDQGPFLVKLDSAGSALWARRGSSSGGASEVASDGTNIFLLGAGTVTLGGITVTNVGAWIAKCDTNGTFAWVKPVGPVTGTALAADGAGGVCVAGTFFGTVSVGGFIVTNANAQDIFWARVGGNGSFTWVKSGQSPGGNNPPGIRTLRVDAAGQLWAAGDFSGSINLGGAALTNLFSSTSVSGYGVVQAFVARLQLDGSLLWQTATTNAAAIQSLRLSLAGSNAVVAGYFRAGAVTWGGQTFSNASFWAGRINNASQMQQAAAASVYPYTYPVSVAADSLGNTYIGLTVNGNTNSQFGNSVIAAGPELGRALFAM